MRTARDIMTTKVISVTPDTTVEELARLLIKHHFKGVPVVDDAGKLVGVVTENDLITKEKRLHIPTVVRILDAFIYLESQKKFEEDLHRMVASKVGDICSRDVVTVTEDTSVTEMATLMSDKGVQILPVVKEGKMVGIVGKEDILRAVTQF